MTEIVLEKLAHELICSKRLVVGDVKLEIVEVECYHQSPSHPDPFVHCHSDQLTSDCWYFHKMRKSYRSGTYKGLDYTFGGPEEYGGILIRSVIHDGGLIEGPCKVVNLLLELSGVSSIDDLVSFDSKPLSAIGFSGLYIVDYISEHDVVTTPRVGLSLSGDKPLKFEYIMKPYRYIRSDIASQIKKYKYLIDLPNSTKTGARNERYKKWFEKGKKMEVSDFFAGKMKVQEMCKLYGCWWNKFGDEIKPIKKESLRYEDKPGVEIIDDVTTEQCNCGSMLLIRQHGLEEDEAGVYAICPKCLENLYL